MKSFPEAAGVPATADTAKMHAFRNGPTEWSRRAALGPKLLKALLDSMQPRAVGVHCVYIVNGQKSFEQHLVHL